MTGQKGKLSANTSKQVRAIAKKVVLREAETKSAIFQTGNNHYHDLVYAQNLIFGIAQGTSANSIIGEKLLIKNINLKGVITNLNNTSATNSSLMFRTVIIRTKTPLVNTFGVITQDQVFRQNYLEPATTGMLDLHKVDVLYDKTHLISQPNISNVDNQRPFSLNLKVNKTHFVDTDNGGYLKDKNYYLITTCHKSGVIVSNVGYLRVTWTVNFKDT